MITFLISTIIIVSVSLRVIPNGRVSPIFSPGDTRIVSYGSAFFCAGITLRDQSTRVGSSLYLITDTPALTDQNNFTIVYNELTIANNNYRYWSYYLYPDSELSLELCTLPDSAGGAFYLIKGKDRFEKWIEEPTTDLAVAFFSIGPLPCSEPRNRLSYRARSEDDYYLVFFNNRLYPHLPYAFLRLNLTMSFYRFEYSIDDLELNPNCSVATTGECTITVPYGSNYRALIVTDIPEDPDWEENVDIGVHCVDRAWAFAVVILVPMAVVTTVTVTIVAILFWQLIKHGCLLSCDQLNCVRTPQSVVTTYNEPNDETKSSELPPAAESQTTTEEDDFKSVDPS